MAYENLSVTPYMILMPISMLCLVLMAQGFGMMKPQSSDPTHVGQALSTAPKVGLDISQLDFVKKASAVYNKAVEKSNNK